LIPIDYEPIDERTLFVSAGSGNSGGLQWLFGNGADVDVRPHNRPDGPACGDAGESFDALLVQWLHVYFPGPGVVFLSIDKPDASDGNADPRRVAGLVATKDAGPIEISGGQPPTFVVIGGRRVFLISIDTTGGTAEAVAVCRVTFLRKREVARKGHR
jgi:hypothetical protein